MGLESMDIIPEAHQDVPGKYCGSEFQKTANLESAHKLRELLK
jgi:hypothetical protein